MSEQELLARLTIAEKNISEAHKKIDELEKEAQQREVRNLRWGINILGGTILVLGTYLWSQVGHLFNFEGRQ